MHNFKAGMLPTSFDHLFTNLESVHNYDTRNKTNYRFEIHKIKSVLTNRPKLWNSLPHDIEMVSSVKTFKESISLFLRNKNK